MRNQAFDTFWHGAALSPLHWACLNSFVQRGHRMRVFSYHDLEVPPGVTVGDARTVLPEDLVFEFEKSFSAFSNIFRYRLLLQGGGWWVDTDVYCLHEDIPECRYAWAKQNDHEINGAVLKAPAGDAAFQAILDESLVIGKSIKVWGELGPSLLTRHLANRSFEGHYGSTREFYPVHWLEPHLFWMPDGLDAVMNKCSGSPFVHLWGAMFRHFGIDVRTAAPAGSFLDRLHRESGYPRDLPGLSPEAQQTTLSSIATFLEVAWVRQALHGLRGHPDYPADSPEGNGRAFQ